MGVSTQTVKSRQTALAEKLKPSLSEGPPSTLTAEEMTAMAFTNKWIDKTEFNHFQKKTVHLRNLLPREQEILALVAEGKTNREVARSLPPMPQTKGSHPTRQTVKNQMTSLFGKLGVSNRREAMIIYFLAQKKAQPTPV